jgi:ABC-type glutathione transport system ATPase component
MSQQIDYNDRPWLDPDAEPFIKVQSVSKHFGDFTAVDSVDLEIYKGELFCLLGGSGCGKTTLLRMLAGFETPSSGSILIDGINMTDVPPYERPVNMMFQGDFSARRGDVGDGRADPVSQTQTAPAIGRTETARCAGARSDQATQDAAARRTIGSA